MLQYEKLPPKRTACQRGTWIKFSCLSHWERHEASPHGLFLNITKLPRRFWLAYAAPGASASAAHGAAINQGPALPPRHESGLEDCFSFPAQQHGASVVASRKGGVGNKHVAALVYRRVKGCKTWLVFCSRTTHVSQVIVGKVFVGQVRAARFRRHGGLLQAWFWGFRGSPLGSRFRIRQLCIVIHITGFLIAL